MKSKFKIATAVTGIFQLGLGTASILHAQTKPPACTFVEIDVKDQDGYTKDFLPKAQANIKEWAANTSQAALIKRSALVDRRHQTAWCSCNFLT